MTYITKKCPHCKSSYSIMQPKGTSFYGCPIRQCATCGKQFLDKDYREIAIDGIRPVDMKRVTTGTIILSVLGFLFGLVLVYCYFSDMQSVWYLVGAAISVILAGYLVIGEITGYDDRQAFLELERKRSEARLRDPNYIYTLRKLGYYVPDSLLKKINN